MRKLLVFSISLFLLGVTSVWAQKTSFTGKVTTQSNEPLIGANVYFRNTTIGTATNSKGEFELNRIPPGDYKLVVSYSGYRPHRDSIHIGNGTKIQDFQLVPSTSNLGEVVVTGTGTPHHLKSAPVQTELLTGKLIKSVSSSDFSELMSGVSPSFDFNPGTMGAFLTLNGLGNDFILILIDGKRTYGDLGGQSDLTRINPSNIERIEVVKGASSSLYGSDAIAGVINIITKKSHQRLLAESNWRVGEYGNLQQTSNLTINLGRISSKTTYATNRTDGWQINEFELDDDELVETEKMTQYPYTDFTLSQELSYSPTRKMSISAYLSTHEKDYKRPISAYSYGFLFDDFSYGAGAKYLLKGNNYLSLDFHSDEFKYYYKYNSTYKDYEAGDQSLNTMQRLEESKLKYFLNPNEQHKITLGIDYSHEKLESDGRIIGKSANVYTLAAYAQDEVKFLENLSVVAGLRLVKHREFGTELTPKISTLWNFGDVNIRGTYAKGFKAPTLKELYYHYTKRGTLYLGNVDLNPQSSNYYAGSFEFIKSLFSASLSVYQNDVNDLIDYQTVETTPEDASNGIKRTRQHFNIEEAQTRGVDFLFNATLGGGFTIGGGYSYVDARNVSSDIRLEGVAHNYGNVRFIYDHNWRKYALNMTLSGRFQDDKFYDDGNATGYSLWKLTTRHQIRTNSLLQFELTAGIDNLFDYVDDKPFGSHYGTLNPGRSFFAGLNIQIAQ